MGIQSKKSKTDARKNTVTVNINIEENTKPLVVKQPKPIVVKTKPVVVKSKGPDKVPDKVPDNRVEELKQNANQFQNLRDRALNQGVAGFKLASET